MTANEPIDFEKQIQSIVCNPTIGPDTKNRLFIELCHDIASQIEAQTIERCAEEIRTFYVLSQKVQDIERLYAPKPDKEEGK